MHKQLVSTPEILGLFVWGMDALCGPLRVYLTEMFRGWGAAQARNLWRILQDVYLTRPGVPCNGGGSLGWSDEGSYKISTSDHGEKHQGDD
jgi:hypothetical protein